MKNVQMTQKLQEHISIRSKTQVLHVCSELFPLLKTGGLGDVVGALPQAQISNGTDARILIPAFPNLRKGIRKIKVVVELQTFAGFVRLVLGSFNNIFIYLIDAPNLYDRSGSPYHDQLHFAYVDNYLRFALLGWMGCEIASGIDSYWKPDIIHAHDWHAGLTCAYLEARGRPAKSVFTIHNLAYQGLFSAQHMDHIHLPPSFFNMHGLEFYGQISYLKAGLYYADHITAVSPTYAQEITKPEFGYGMESLLERRLLEGRLSGILNGVDPKIWNPADDLLLNTRYNSNTLDEKTKNKLQLQITMGLKVNEKTPVFAVISRLTRQKGLDLILEALPTLLAQGGQMVLLGQGDSELQQGCLSAAAENPGNVGVQIGFHEIFSHRIIGGADIIMVPSRFEPCGLTQLYGLKYGTLPLVRRTGGLADTVNDCSLENLSDGTANGFSFEDSNTWSLLRAIRRAFILWSRPLLWRYVQRQAMNMDFSWKVVAKAYQDLYQRLL